MFDPQEIKRIGDEITTKKMAPIAGVIKVLEEHGEYCPRCEYDEPTIYYDPTNNTGPRLYCPVCGYSLKWDTIIKRARELPYDYLERLITGPAKGICVEQVGEDVWISDPYTVELAGKLPLSYPDRDKFRATKAVGELLASLKLDEYKEAKLSSRLYRTEYNLDTHIAALETDDRTVYIKEKYARRIYGVYKPYIREPLDPVLVKVGDRIHVIIMPIRENSNKPFKER